ncbi:uncharacterized membrane protein YcaP (DUF421 family) [Orenia metallireducens]|jgi:uncharacterized membrane protein YcaP (DUF421 family)|uniref:Uncharacterized membrane protein YcaP, DUF421 family n=1 Tax=Orenia metallireducens TaxID=1413210 RepID=A0A285GHG8_9FIRM|nr:DUF421 domain-containing protein [Orenia metallireducens]PRX30498.1 uncharacterized membrane protein YcaP (DUF421 family) [Orenia metallireducens]SNY22885.1 Uncharacterized membrane protein YcaP, DUF421 family [Orenia metallireducens]
MPEYIEVIWKTMVVFLILAILTRLIGRKLLEQITFFEFVTGVTIGTVAGAYIVNAIKGAWVLLSPVIFTVCTIGLGFISLKSLRIRKLVEGEPVVIIQNGKILEENMFKARYNLDQLEMQLRNKNIFDFNEVEFAILEPTGQLSVLKKTPFLSATLKDLNLSTNYKGVATEIIKDGDVLEQNLKQNNLDFSWLYNQLRDKGINDISKVMLAMLNTDGTLYIDLKGEKPQYTQKVED